MGWILLATLSVIVIVYLLQKLPKRNFPPGPRSLPILGHFHLLGKNPRQDLHRLARKHGPIMGLRFGFVPTVIISSPEAAELVLKTHDLIFANRPRSQASECMSYGQRNLVFGPYSPYWRNMRKLCTLELLSNLRISNFQPMRRAEVDLFVSSLESAANNRETVDLSSRISGLSGDINCLMIFGKKYDDRDLDEKWFRALFAETMELGAKFNLADYFPYIGVLDLQGMRRRMKELSRIFDVCLEKIIDEHVQSKKAGKNDGTEDFVDTMMSIIESGYAHSRNGHFINSSRMGTIRAL